MDISSYKSTTVYIKCLVLNIPSLRSSVMFSLQSLLTTFAPPCSNAWMIGDVYGSFSILSLTSWKNANFLALDQKKQCFSTSHELGLSQGNNKVHTTVSTIMVTNSDVPIYNTELDKCDLPWPNQAQCADTRFWVKAIITNYDFWTTAPANLRSLARIDFEIWAKMYTDRLY